MKRPTWQIWFELLLWLLATSYYIRVVVHSRWKEGFVLLTVIYVAFTVRMLARHISPTAYIYDPLVAAGQNCKSKMNAAWQRMHDSQSPENQIRFTAASNFFYKTRMVFFLVVVLILILVVSMSLPLPDDPQVSTYYARLQSFGGILAVLVGMSLFSADFFAIPWFTVASGILIQYIIGLIVLRTQVGFEVFQYLSKIISDFLDSSAYGSSFVFGQDYNPAVFALKVLPTIIFFCAFVGILYYVGAMQYTVAKMAWLTMWLMDVSGAESVVAAASPFIGQGENALLVQPFVEYMTSSELHSIMTSGFATISGSLFTFYVSKTNNGSALLTACVMSIPAGLLLSKMRIPEKEEPITKGKVKIPDSREPEANILHAASNGSATGVQLALLIAGALIAIISLFNVANNIFGFLFEMVGVYNLMEPNKDGSFPRVTIQFALSFFFWPIAWLIGIPPENALKAAELMALKMVVNEFEAYSQLAATEHLTARTKELMVYALCGFANISSIGIQLGVLSVIAPTRKLDFSKLVVSAMLTGTVSTWLNAAIAGTLL